MKLSMTRVLTPLAALALAFSAQAALPANEGFEGSAMDANWTFVAGPDSAADASVITAYGSDAKPADTLVGDEKPGLPDGFATDGDKYLKLSTEDGTLFRNVNGGAVKAVGAGLYLDTVVQFTVTDSGDRPVPSTTLGEEDKFIIWLEVDSVNNTTNLCVYGGEYSLTETTIGLDGRKVYKLDGDFEPIQPGSWHRLTVKAVADMGLKLSSGSSYSMGTVPAFQVYIDGKLCAADDILFNDLNLVNECEDADLVNDKEFIPAMVGGGQLTKIGFSGEGKLDDVVITSNIPGVVPHETVALAWDTTVLTSFKATINGEETALLTGGSASFNVPAGAVITFAKADMTFADGKPNRHGFDTWTTSSGSDIEFADANDIRTATVTAGGTITMAFADITPTFNFTLDFAGLSDALTSGDLSGISYTLNGGSPVVLNEDQILDSSYVITGAKGGDVIAVTLSFTAGSQYKAGTFTADAGVTVNGNVFTIGADVEDAVTGNLVAEIPAAKVFSWDGNEYTFDEAVAALAGGTIVTSSSKPLALTADIDLADETVKQITVPAEGTVWLDLAGHTLTGDTALDGYMFVVNGELNILDSSDPSVGAIEAPAIATVDGTLNITGGSYEGTITKGTDGTVYITGGAFDAEVAGATFPVGYGLEYVELQEAYVYGVKTYTIEYDNNGGEGSVADTTFTVLAAGVIADGSGLTAPSGKTFNGWNTAANGSGTAYAAGAATPEVTAELDATTTLYAQWADAGKAIEPGEQDPTEYASEADAKAAAANIEVKAAKEVEDELTGEGVLAAYLAKFEVKSVKKSEGVWVNEVALTSAAAADLQTEANADAVAAAAKVAAAATAAQTVTITTTPGFYYSVKSGATLGGMVEGARTLATGASMDVTLPKGDTAGFYSILVNVTAE